MNNFKFTRQPDQMDCGPSCIQMITNHYGKYFSLEYLREICHKSKEGVSLLSINEALQLIGFETEAGKVSIEELFQCDLPCILFWNQEHYVVLYKIKKAKDKKRVKFYIADPAHDKVIVDFETFTNSFLPFNELKGVVLLMSPTKYFFDLPNQKKQKANFSFLYKYLIPHKKNIFKLILGMLITSIITLAFPILTQILVDEGVNGKNISLVYLILGSQILLFFGDTIINLLRGWILLHINARVSLSIISDFLVKLLKLPIRYFDTKSVGDLSQRITDHNRIEVFLTNDSINSLFSIANIIVFSCILAYYNISILLVFILFSSFGLLWVFMFGNKRKQLDYKRFSRSRENQDKLFEMITGMQEIKLYGSENSKRWEWERLQVKYFQIRIKSLTLHQYQQTGFLFFTHLKNIVISFIAAKSVITGNISLGEMLSISYIIGQTNSPLEQLIDFVNSAQDARLSMERLQEVHNKAEETEKNDFDNNVSHESIYVQNLKFQYEGPSSQMILNDLSFEIPKGKITAIVGPSGSGKSTLLKILLNFYEPTSGIVKIGKIPLKNISPIEWRSQCGTVMQNGYIFYDSIKNNIALDGGVINELNLKNAISIANLGKVISKLPLKLATKIGTSGIGLSGGQSQRVLIARAVYKNPNYLFFDEATSALDANNEKEIMIKLNDFFNGKTVVVVAHRLSTVKNADNIIVLEDGQIVEEGHHNELVKAKGTYYELVKNQLELGN